MIANVKTTQYRPKQSRPNGLGYGSGFVRCDGVKKTYLKVLIPVLANVSVRITH